MTIQVPLEIAFQGMDPSPAVETRIRESVDRLERYSDRITSCRVVVEAPHRAHNKGNLFSVRVHVVLPGRADVVSTRNGPKNHAHEDVYVALRDAFNSVKRQLQSTTRKMRGKVKSHEVPPHGQVLRLNRDAGFGFIETSDGREIYFHRNSVLNDGFQKLEEGDEVRFSEEEGEKGPQASTVHIVGKHHVV